MGGFKPGFAFLSRQLAKGWGTLRRQALQSPHRKRMGSKMCFVVIKINEGMVRETWEQFYPHLLSFCNSVWDSCKPPYWLVKLEGYGGTGVRQLRKNPLNSKGSVESKLLSPKICKKNRHQPWSQDLVLSPAPEK